MLEEVKQVRKPYAEIPSILLSLGSTQPDRRLGDSTCEMVQENVVNFRRGTISTFIYLFSPQNSSKTNDEEEN